MSSTVRSRCAHSPSPEVVGDYRHWVEPVVLEGRWVRLEPLSLDHVAGLTDVGLEAEIWRWMPVSVQSPGEMRALVETALADASDGSQVPFATIERESNRVVGSTRYMNIDGAHRRLEIGFTWISPHWQRSAINTEAKLLMMRHAFDTLGALRVEFKTDSLNERSRAALLGIGATRRERCATTWSRTPAGAGTRSTTA